MGTPTDPCKQSFYFPSQMIAQIKEEARRLDRSLSWVLQQAWRIAYLRLRAHPGAAELIEQLGQPPTATPTSSVHVHWQCNECGETGLGPAPRSHPHPNKLVTHRIA